MNIEIFTTGISILSCLWIILKYFQQPKDNIGLLLIFVLAISDLLFAFSNLGLHFSEEETNTHELLIFFSMQFSIMWASAVSYIVYKSLQDTNLNTKRLFRIILGIVILTSTAITTLYLFLLMLLFNSDSLSLQMEGSFSLLYLSPLTISLLLTFVYYSMSISILKQEAEANPLSTKVYVRTLRSYSLVPFLTYGPFILFLIMSILDLMNSVSLEITVNYLGALKTLATLSGFFNTLIFVFQGTGNLKAPGDFGENYLGENLTLDMTV